MEGVVQNLAASVLKTCTPLMPLEALNLDSAAADAPAAPWSHQGANTAGYNASGAPATVAVQPGQRQGVQGGSGAAQLPRRTGALTPASFWTAADGTATVDDRDSSHGSCPVLLPIELVRQSRPWDCGVACVQMVLAYLGTPRTLDELLELAGTNSIWTVDLAWLLARTAPAGTMCLLCTTALGAADTHAELDMYAREFDADQQRVNTLFRDASQLGFCYCQATLSREDLARLLHTKTTVVLCLVDLRVLRHHRHLARRRSGASPTWTEKIEAWAWGKSVEDYQNSSRYASSGTSSNSEDSNGNYLGHYVLLVGHDHGSDDHNHGADASTNDSSSEGGLFAYLDPGQGAGLYTATGDVLDAARFAEGTDEDLLLVQVPPVEAAHSSHSSGFIPCFQDAGFDGFGGSGLNRHGVRSGEEVGGGDRRDEMDSLDDGFSMKPATAVTSAMTSVNAQWFKRSADQALAGLWRATGVNENDRKSH